MCAVCDSCAWSAAILVAKVSVMSTRVIRLRTGHHPHLFDRPCLEALVAEQRDVGEGVAGVGVDRLDGGLAGGEVVRVRGLDPLPVALGRLDEHPPRPHLPDHPADVAPQVVRDGQLAVPVAEVDDVGGAPESGGGALLGAPNARYVRSWDVRVEAAGVTVGDDAERDRDPLSRPLGQGAGRAEVDVVGVGGDHQDALDLGVR